jgi:hypothetical protein
MVGRWGLFRLRMKLAKYSVSSKAEDFKLQNSTSKDKDKKVGNGKRDSQSIIARFKAHQRT